MASTAPSLPPQEVEKIKTLFNKYDSDKNGTLDKQELKVCLEESLNRTLSDNLLNRYLDVQFQASDKDYNGVIDWQEFQSLYAKIYLNPELPIHMHKTKTLSKPELESGQNAPKVEKNEVALTEEQYAAAQAKFREADADNSGFIDKQELHTLLKDTMGKKMSDGMVKRYVDMQFNMWDKDGSGEIDFEEFVKLYAKMYVADPQSDPKAVLSRGVALPFPGLGPRK